MEPTKLGRIIGELHAEWRRINQVIWELEKLAAGKPRRGRPPKFDRTPLPRRPKRTGRSSGKG